jgi:DNA-binding transcriptional ArsR family regulator
MNAQQLTLASRLLKGFADRSRLAILNALIDGPKTVSEIVKETELSQPNTSAHLACLLECHLVQRTKKGRQVFYRVSQREVGAIVRAAGKILDKQGDMIDKCKNY